MVQLKGLQYHSGRDNERNQRSSIMGYHRRPMRFTSLVTYVKKTSTCKRNLVQRFSFSCYFDLYSLVLWAG